MVLNLSSVFCIFFLMISNLDSTVLIIAPSSNSSLVSNLSKPEMSFLSTLIRSSCFKKLLWNSSALGSSVLSIFFCSISDRRLFRRIFSSVIKARFLFQVSLSKTSCSSFRVIIFSNLNISKCKKYKDRLSMGNKER